jgi:hypothetical protein
MMEMLFCRPKSLPGEPPASARRSGPGDAADEITIVRPDPTPGRRGPSQLRIVVVNKFRWPEKGVELSVQFLDNPSQTLRRMILSHMNAWSSTANVSFTETKDGTGHVRIARYDHPASVAGYWSYLGKQILTIADSEPTMNLQGFTEEHPESEFKRVVRHETGHTLGFHHEHMRREIVDKIDRQKAYDYFRMTDGWSKEDVDAQVLTPLSEASVMGTVESDPTSIMCYQLPGKIMKDGKDIPGGLDINELDANFAGTLYPKDVSNRR